MARQHFRIEPLHDLAELERRAERTTPPRDPGADLPADLVDLRQIPGLRFDIRYATSDNFLAQPFYSSAGAFLQRPAAEALARVQQALGPRGLGLLVYDAYRPWSVTKMFWDATPELYHRFLGNPERGSRHNRGCAVDLTLVEAGSGALLAMPCEYDEFTERAYANYAGASAAATEHRGLLREVMHRERFEKLEEEWWHFDYADWRRYPILNLRFDELPR